MMTDIGTWQKSPELRRMPYALITVPGQLNRLLAVLRGGALLVTDDAGESWSQLSLQLDGLIDVSAA